MLDSDAVLRLRNRSEIGAGPDSEDDGNDGDDDHQLDQREGRAGELALLYVSVLHILLRLPSTA